MMGHVAHDHPRRTDFHFDSLLGFVFLQQYQVTILLLRNRAQVTEIHANTMHTIPSSPFRRFTAPTKNTRAAAKGLHNAAPRHRLNHVTSRAGTFSPL
jgi:hypothetical protein